MHQIHNNENGYAWQEVGAKGTFWVKSNTGRQRLNIMGALNAVSLNICSLLTQVNCDRELMKVFLKEIRNEYREAKEIRIYLDNAGYNRAKAVLDKLEFWVLC